MLSRLIRQGVGMHLLLNGKYNKKSPNFFINKALVYFMNKDTQNNAPYQIFIMENDSQY